MLQVFAQEIQDGLEKKILESSAISYASEIKISDDATKKQIILSSSNAGKEDVDLFYIDSVLVSVGWNKNDDIFEAAEVWNARHTPVNKQFNLLHNDNYIVGHIISSLVVAEEKLVADDTEETPTNFDIVVGSVIYKKWQDEIRQEYINKVIAEIKEGKWFVSMECLFPTFDYGLISSSGEQKVISRNKESAFLTKYLARYGGTGTYKDYKIGRVLRDIVFSGKGLVKNPANPRSVIFTDKVSFAGVNSDVKFLIPENIKMADMDKSVAEVTSSFAKQVADLTSQLEIAKAENFNRDKQAVAEAEKKTKAQIDDLNKSVSDLNGEINTLKETLVTKEAEAAKTKKEMDEKDKQAKEYAEKATKLESEILTAKRVSTLVSAGATEIEAVAFVSKWISASDEQFTELAELFTKKAPEPKKTEAKIEDVVDEGKAKINAPAGDSNQELQTAVASWFSEKISKKQDKE